MSDGVFGKSLNPIYLAMAVVLAGFVLVFQSLLGALVVPLFVWTITESQIKPEEEALRTLFGDEYAAYCERVRRWI